MEKKQFIIIDSFALIFRAYYAYPPTLSTKDGQLMNAVYGFGTLMLEVIKKFEPEYIVAVFDSASPTIRSTEFATYKANRKERDPELISQIPLVRKLIESFEIPVLNVEGYEADDIIATLCKTHDDTNLEKIVVTGDKDLFQLINDHTYAYMAGRTFSQSKLYKRENVIEKMEITPEQVPDYKGLAGDPSDNIPGVAGIGDKSARQLLQKYNSIEEIYEDIENVDNKWKNRLSENYEIAIKSKELATVVPDVPISFKLESAKFHKFPLENVIKLFEEFEFKSLKKKVEDMADKMGFLDEENLGLFEENIEEKVVKEKSLQLEKLKTKSLFLSFELEDDSVSPINYDLNEFFIDDGSGVCMSVSNDQIEDLFEKINNEKIKIIGINLKDLFHALNNNGIDLSNIDFEDLGFATAILSKGEFGHSISDVSDFTDVKFSESSQSICINLNASYEFLKEEFSKDRELFEVYELEKSIISIVIDMERKGITFDSKKTEEFKEKLEKEKERIQEEIFSHSDYEFNINSPKQVGEVLFEKLGLPSGRKTKSGSYSTSERTLRNLLEVHPIIPLILSYREVDKLLSTYIKALPHYVDQDGKVHATFDQLGAVSGRFSSKDPNMQNIPAVNDIGVNVRELFIASPGKTLVAFDYSQQELRILAAFAGEELMIESFNKGEDIHAITAAQLFGKDVSEVTKDERATGKVINFSVVYGVSSYGLSDNLKIGRKEAGELIDNYYKKYNKIAEYFEEKKREIHTIKVASTVLGRKRINPMKSSSQWFVKNAVERELLNFAIQGTAADLMKMAMVEIGKAISNYDASLLLQIHDEFLFEVDENENIEKFSNEIVSIMENVKDIGVKYKVDMKSGKVWGRME